LISIINEKEIIYDAPIFALVIALLLFVKVPYIKVLLPFILILTYSYKTQGLKISLGFSKSKNLLKLIDCKLKTYIKNSCNSGCL